MIVATKAGKVFPANGLCCCRRGPPPTGHVTRRFSPELVRPFGFLKRFSVHIVGPKMRAEPTEKLRGTGQQKNGVNYADIVRQFWLNSAAMFPLLRQEKRENIGAR